VYCVWGTLSALLTESNISHLQPFDRETGYLNVIIETPMGSRNKFKYNEKHGLFMFDKALPIGQSFAFDFGFLPSTLGEDGDPLDALVLTSEPTFVGCLVPAKLLGVIEAEQTVEGETTRNDRFISVPIEAKSQKPPEGSIDTLDLIVAGNIAKFFIVYNDLQDRKFKVLRISGPDRAMQLIKEGGANAKPGKKKIRSAGA
jgi:inorganic pyrophosphatase